MAEPCLRHEVRGGSMRQRRYPRGGFRPGVRVGGAGRPAPCRPRVAYRRQAHLLCLGSGPHAWRSAGLAATPAGTVGPRPPAPGWRGSSGTAAPSPGSDRHNTAGGGGDKFALSPPALGPPHQRPGNILPEALRPCGAWLRHDERERPRLLGTRQCAKMSSSSKPPRSRLARVGRKRKQASAASMRPSRFSMASSLALMACR
jgi:hypothetical protein